MVNNNLNEINAVIDSSQKITASGGFWWLKRFMERLGVGAVFNQDYGIKKRRRRFSERDYFLSVLYSLLSGGKAISDIGKIRKDKAFKRLSGLTRGIPTAGAEFAYKPIGIAEPQRVAVRRFRKSQPGLFDEYNYPFVMTNRGGLTAKEIFDIHSTKSGYENNFKDLLSGLGLHHPRFMKLNANRFFCSAAMLAYNIMQAAKYFVLNGTKFFFTGVSGFIYRFVTNAGRLVTHNFRATLKLTEYPLDIGFIERRVANIRTG